MTYGVGNPDPGLGQGQKYGRDNWLIGFNPPPLDNCIANYNSNINKRYKTTCTDSLPLKKTTYYQKNEKQHKYMSKFHMSQKL